MTLEEALTIVIARTGHARYRDLCDPSHPSFEAYRALVMELAEDRPGRPLALVGNRPLILPASAVPASSQGCGCGRA